MRLLIRYIYYKLYTWHFNIFEKKDCQAVSAFLQLTILFFITSLLVIMPIAMYLYPGIFTGDNVLIIGIGPLIIIILSLYLVLFRKRTHEVLINEFESMDRLKKGKLERRIIYWVIIIIILSFIIISFLFENVSKI